jgi:hypothetical protein
VPLDLCEGDDRWVVRRRGAAATVLSACESLARALPQPTEALRRVGIARRLAARFPGPTLALVLDFRSVEVGQSVRTRRRGSSQEAWTRLPWLVLHTGEVEITVTRTLHEKEVRTFRQGVERRATRCALDEVRVRATDGRGIRRAVARATSWGEVHPDALAEHVPGLDTELPPTAPGSRLEEQAPWAVGLVASLVMFLALPLLLRPSPAPATPTKNEVLKEALDSPDADLTRSGLRHRVADRRRQALVASRETLPRFERWRALRHAVDDTHPRVRELALGLLEQESALGTATLVALHDHSRESTTRERAFQLLANRRDPRDLRARRLALRGLAGRGPDLLRSTWLIAVAEAITESATPRDEPALAALSSALKAGDLELRAHAGRALAHAAPKRSLSALESAFADALSATVRASTPQHRWSCTTLAQALLLARPGHPAVREASTRRDLSRRVRRALARLL